MFIVANIISDILLFNLGVVFAFFLRFWSFKASSFNLYRALFPYLTIIFILSLAVTGIYRYRFSSFKEIVKKVLRGVVMYVLLAISLLYTFRAHWGEFPTSIFLISSLVHLLLLCTAKGIIYKARGKLHPNVIFVTNANLESIFYKKMKDIDEAVIKEEIRDFKRLMLLIELTKEARIKLSVMPALYDKVISHKLEGVIPHHLPLSLYFSQDRPLRDLLIRSFDVSLSLLAVFILSPLFVLIFFLVKIDSPGPVIYKQKRIGKDGQIFTMYKFRTMVSDAEKKWGLLPAERKDPRITKIGALLRSARLDEIPQLFNVLKGEMSMVGPRPENIYRTKKHKDLQGIRLAVKPGLTGLAQIRSFYDLKPSHKIKYDKLYIEKQSLGLYLEVILKTIPVVLLRKGW